MTRTPDLASILKGLPRARHLLAPLREVREKEYGAPLPPAVFPVSAFATESLPREDAWKLFRELRGDPRLANVAVTVTTPESEVLASFWEDACPAAERLLSLRTSVGEPESTAASNSALAWVKSTAGQRTLGRAAKNATPPHGSPDVEWSTSLRDAYAHDDTQTVYVLDVEPWASPLALTWLLTPARWASVAAMLRRWHEAHGFAVVALGTDMLEAYVERPPSTASDVGARLVEAVSLGAGYLDEGFGPVVEMLRGNAWQFRFDI